MDSHITSSYGRLLDVLDKRLQNLSLRPFSVGHTTSICNVQRTFNFDLQKRFWMDVLITSTYGRLSDGLDRRHKNFHFRTILSWSHNVYDRPPTDVIGRFFAHWEGTEKMHDDRTITNKYRTITVLSRFLAYAPLLEYWRMRH